MKQPAIYIMTNKRNGTLYVGVTSNLIQRVFQHKHKLMPGFTEKYGCNMLVYYERYDTMEQAIIREKRIKVMLRKIKIELIQSKNPEWNCLYGFICQ